MRYVTIANASANEVKKMERESEYYSPLFAAHFKKQCNKLQSVLKAKYGPLKINTERNFERKATDRTTFAAYSFVTQGCPASVCDPTNEIVEYLEKSLGKFSYYDQANGICNSATFEVNDLLYEVRPEGQWFGVHFGTKGPIRYKVGILLKQDWEKWLGKHPEVKIPLYVKPEEIVVKQPYVPIPWSSPPSWSRPEPQVPADPPVHIKIESPKKTLSLLEQCRELWTIHNKQFSTWERDFVKSIGSQLNSGKALSVKQYEVINKILTKYR